MLRNLFSSPRRLIILVAGIIFLVLMILVIIAQSRLEGELRKNIHSLIVEGSEGLYNYRLEKVNGSIIGGNVTVEGLSVFVDSNRYRQLQQQHALPAITMDLQLEKASFKGLAIIGLLLRNRLQLNEISTSQASISITSHEQEEEEYPSAAKPLWKAIEGSLRYIAVDRLKLEGINFKYTKAGAEDPLRLQFERLFATAENIRIDSAAAVDTTRMLYAKDLALRLRNVDFITADSNYRLNASWVSYSSSSRQVRVDSLHFRPVLDIAAQYERLGYEVSLYDLKAPELRLENVAARTFLHQDRLECDSIIISNPVVNVYHDKSQDREFRSKLGNYPHQLVQSVTFPLNIRHLVLQNASVVYTEKSKVTEQEGKVSVDALNMHVSNMTNKVELIARDPLMKASAVGKILGSPIEASFDFYLNSDSGRFDARGRVENIGARQLEPISLPLAQIKIPSLHISHVDFNIRATELNGYSDVNMRYSNLSISIQKMDDAGRSEQMGLVSRAVNRFIVINENPSGGNERVARNIQFMRLHDQTFFGLVWRCIFNGMQDIMLSSGSLL